MDVNDQPAERPKKKARRKDEKYIHEDADTIVDLADIKAMSSIGCKLLRYFVPFETVNRLNQFKSIYILLLFISIKANESKQ